MWLFIFFFKTTAEPQVAEPRFRFTTVCSTYIQYYCRTENSFSTHKSLWGDGKQSSLRTRILRKTIQGQPCISLFVSNGKLFLKNTARPLLFSRTAHPHSLRLDAALCRVPQQYGRQMWNRLHYRFVEPKNDTRFAALSQSCGSAQMVILKISFYFSSKQLHTQQCAFFGPQPYTHQVWSSSWAMRQTDRKTKIPCFIVRCHPYPMTPQICLIDVTINDMWMLIVFVIRAQMFFFSFGATHF